MRTSRSFAWRSPSSAPAALGDLDLNLVRTQDAEWRFEQARTIYQPAGYPTGERDIRLRLPMVRVELEWLTPRAGLKEGGELRRRITALSHAYFTGQANSCRDR